MQDHLIWGYLHIILFVFWWGADIGALMALAMARNAKRSFEARMALTKLGRALHVFPSACLPLTLPVGLQLTRTLNLYPITDRVVTVAWVLAAYWLGTLVAMRRWDGTALAVNLGRLRLVSYVIVGLIFVVLGMNSLATGAPLEETWYAVKLLLFGLVFWTTLAGDLAYQPFQTPFMEIGQHGLDARTRRSRQPRREQYGCRVSDPLRASGPHRLHRQGEAVLAGTKLSRIRPRIVFSPRGLDGKIGHALFPEERSSS